VLYIAIKALNNIARPNSIVLILLVSSAYLRINKDSLPLLKLII
jgi:hypothetical protein